MKKKVNGDGHVFSFLLHEVICVSVNINNVHWVLFAICRANREILVIGSLYDPTSPLHVTIYHNMVQFIQDYYQSKYLPQD
jgi:Ulp1 family protease